VAPPPVDAQWRAAEPRSVDGPWPAVAIVARGGTGGSSSAAAEVALALAASGRRTAVFSRDPIPRLGPLPGEAAGSDGGGAANPLAVLALLAGPGPQLEEALHREHRRAPFDIVHVHFGGPHLCDAVRFVTRATPRPALVLTLHGSDVHAHRLGAARLETSQCDAVAVPSNWLQGQCDDLFDDIQVVPNFLDAARWGTGDNPLLRARGERLMFAGHLEPWKGPDVLVAALLQLAGRAVVLDVLGDGSLAQSLAHAADPRVRFWGAVPLGPARLGAADLYIVPSRREAFGMGALEAMARGVPVVASAVGGLRDLVAPVGTLVEPGDPRALAEAVAACLDDRPARIRSASDGLALVREKYDRDPGLARHLRLYACRRD